MHPPLPSHVATTAASLLLLLAACSAEPDEPATDTVPADTAAPADTASADTPPASACAEPVGEPCTVGLGVCATSGTVRCDEASGQTFCDATAGTPTAPACDGLDNDCDGTPDDLTVELTPVPNAPPVDPAPWSLVELAGTPYGAFELGDDVVVLDLSAGTELAKVAGRAPRLFASEQTQRLVLFYLAPAPDELGTPQDEVHLAAITPAGALEDASCLSCADETRSTHGAVLDYDVAFAAGDTDDDGTLDRDDLGCTPYTYCLNTSEFTCPDSPVCSYVAMFIRAADGSLRSAIADAVDLRYWPNTEGVMLNFGRNSGHVHVDFVLPWPTLGFLAAARHDAGTAEDEFLLATMLVQGRAKFANDSIFHDFPVTADTHTPFAIGVAQQDLPALAIALDDTVELSIHRPREFGGGYTTELGPIALEGPPGSVADAPQLVRLGDGTAFAVLFEARAADASHTAELAIVDATDGTVLQRASLPGRLPRLEGERLGTLLGDGTHLTPALATRLCDAE